MTASSVDTVGYHWVNRILSLTFELITFSVFLVDIYRMNLWRKENKQTRKVSGGPSTEIWKKYSHIFTMLALFSYNVMGANYVLNVWSVYDESISCETIEVFSVYSYHICKLLLYIVLLLRIKVAFSESVYYEKIIKMVYLLYVLLLCYILVICFDFFVIHGEKVYSSQTMHYCKLRPMPIWGIAIFLSFDITISVLCCAAFIYPLKKLLKITASSTINQRIYADLISKYGILTTTAIVSTFVFVFLNRLLNIGFFVLFDNVLNALCIVLMSSWYEKWYRLVCCCCKKTVETIDEVSSDLKSRDQMQQQNDKERAAIIDDDETQQDLEA